MLPNVLFPTVTNQIGLQMYHNCSKYLVISKHVCNVSEGELTFCFHEQDPLIKLYLVKTSNFTEMLFMVVAMATSSANRFYTMIVHCVEKKIIYLTSLRYLSPINDE